jgi:uncharacterized membrane protein YeiB
MPPDESRPRVEEALRRLAEIHAQVARSGFYRGYRALPVAFMGATALLAAAVQTLWMPAAGPREHALSWIVVAIVCAGVCGLDLTARQLALPVRETLSAIAQLVPALVVGLVVTFALWGQAERLPGLWTMIFGLGVLASSPYLPRAILGVALFYVAAGIAMSLAVQPGGVASPWEMGLTYGVGHLVSAVILWHDIERGEAR